MERDSEKMMTRIRKSLGYEIEKLSPRSGDVLVITFTGQRGARLAARNMQLVASLRTEMAKGGIRIPVLVKYPDETTINLDPKRTWWRRLFGRRR